MFDIGMTELLVIGIVALIVVGPKDLPGMFRTLGRFTAKARSLGREFTRAMNDAADETGIKDVADDLKKAANPAKTGLNALKDAADQFEKWDPNEAAAAKHGKETAKLAAKRAKEAQERRAMLASKEEAEADIADEKPVTKKAPVKKAAQKTPTKNTPAKKTPAKKPAAKKTTAKKPAAKKPATKAAATKKPAAKKPATSETNGKSDA
ncbi:MAG: twin-arginine translocase subunit TatB [Rhodobacteraceae bacterium]|nr:twin-arginine translocase subunit TatB [Paracoccaceae bacterium]